MENNFLVYDHLLLKPFQRVGRSNGEYKSKYSPYGTFIVINEDITNDLIATFENITF